MGDVADSNSRAYSGRVDNRDVASFCLAIGCLASMIVSVVTTDIEMQLLALAIGTILSFMFLAPMIRSICNRINP